MCGGSIISISVFNTRFPIIVSQLSNDHVRKHSGGGFHHYCLYIEYVPLYIFFFSIIVSQLPNYPLWKHHGEDTLFDEFSRVVVQKLREIVVIVINTIDQIILFILRGRLIPIPYYLYNSQMSVFKN